jgi:hypothetical protein
MPSQEPEQWAASIVLRGSFNPLIFQPGWLKDKGLVSTEALDHAVTNGTVDIIRPDVVQYRISRMTIQVRKDLLMVETAEDPVITVSDLVVGCFNELPETPITMSGMNYHCHFRATMEQMDKIGDVIAPKDNWKLLFGDDAVSTLRGGLRSLVMREPGENPDTDYLDVKIEPSNLLKPGVFIHINDHHQLLPDDEVGGAAAIVSRVRDNFEASVKRSIQLAQKIMELGL